MAISIVLAPLCLSLIMTLSGTVSGSERWVDGVQQRSARQRASVFSYVEVTVRNESRVPPRFPRFLPFANESHPIHLIVESITKSSYSILLVNALPCEGANWCLYGSARGSTEPFRSEAPKRTANPVLLEGGIKGSFIDSECDAYCGQAYVEWQERGYYYAIGIKGPKSMKRILVKMANSAIAVPSSP